MGRCTRLKPKESLQNWWSTAKTPGLLCPARELLFLPAEAWHDLHSWNLPGSHPTGEESPWSICGMSGPGRSDPLLVSRGCYARRAFPWELMAYKIVAKRQKGL